MRSKMKIVSSSCALLSVLLLLPHEAESQWFTPKVSSNEEIFGWIEDITQFGFRRPGTEAEHQTALYIADKLEEFGLQDVHLEPIDIMLWEATDWRLEVEGMEISSFYIPYTKATGAAGSTGELIYVGEGSGEEYELVEPPDQAAKQAFWQDKIVVAEISMLFPDTSLTHPWSWIVNNWEAYENANARGAAGFIGVLRDYWDRNTFYFPADNPSKPVDRDRDIPGMWVSKSDGETIMCMMNGGSAEATMVLEADVDYSAQTYNVVGVLPGKSDDIILVHSHHDAAFYGAVEDASGVAEVLAIAKYFSKISKWWRTKTMVFLTATGHFYDYIGTSTFVENHKDDWVPRIAVNFCVEHLAKEYVEEDGQIVYTGKPERHGMLVNGSALLYSLATSASAINNLPRTYVIPFPFDEYFVTDAWDFAKQGIPAVSMISAPMYIYDLNDTTEKVAYDMLNPVAEAFIDMITEVDVLPPSWL